ncbi:cytochrome c maturation protein CcmE [Thioflexithrix psekupsensis]|uniref:Cytochrome c-type biogenesis protein CcmE n=1 Tax=Thioflexithrix psekupsensis TaxID=1570016 RepID=A0A251X728_9GAMM|nr:cytochrome c maturation protein CcmE [Thioflexithrix psekupsensis]OUD13194.1 cytochrome c biogenesis protein CcmE [Thioflexithrix psekupsensis]
MSFITLTRKHKQRLMVVVLLVVGIASAVGFALMAFQQNMLFFFNPSEVVAGHVPTDRTIRVGGLVTTGSVKRAEDSLLVEFTVTDTQHVVPVQYEGILPDLFREGQGIIAIGRLQPDGTFSAQEVLAKHDETYMPPEVADSLKAAQAAQAQVKMPESHQAN